MNRNYIFRDVNHALPSLLNSLMIAGDEVGSRAGRTMELTHVGITLEQPWHRELLVEHRKPNLAAQIFETMWVLSGRDDMESLVRYLPRAAEFSDDGRRWRAGYGRRIRHWLGGGPAVGGQQGVDQLAYVVQALKSNSLTRQAVISIWDPEVDTEPGKDIPCNDWITFSNRNGKLDMHVGIRSNDIIWGWSGINQFEWSAMLEIVAALVGVQMGRLHFSTTSFHIYDRHWGQARKIVDANVDKAPADLGSPRFDPTPASLEYFDGLCEKWFIIEEQIRTGSIPRVEAARAVDNFPEPMLQSWLRVLQWWWWTGQRGWLSPLAGTALEAATVYSVQPKSDNLAPSSVETNVVSNGFEEVIRVDEVESELEALGKLSPFIKRAAALHLEKDAAYGDSWKRRGEMLGILANIARKVDRLGKSETSDETSADTAMDLMVYLAKYRTWLTDVGLGAAPSKPEFLYSEDPKWANQLMFKVDLELSDSFNTTWSNNALELALAADFDRLEKDAVAQVEDRYLLVGAMLKVAYRLARKLWEAEQPKMTDAASVGGGTPGSWTDEYQGADHE